jgi:uncharacterized protein (DUF2062 family)
VAIFSTPVRKLRALWALAKNERASPKQIGWAVGVGCFVGFSPALGLHGVIALGFATVLKLNRLFCWIGSRSSNMFIIPFTTYAEVEVAHLLRTGSWVAIDREHILEQAEEMVLDWFLGMIPVGLPISAAIGLLAFAWARRRERRRSPQG